MPSRDCASTSLDDGSPSVVNAPAPYGASRPRPASLDDGHREGNRDSHGDRLDVDSWSAPTSFRAHSTPDARARTRLRQRARARAARLGRAARPARHRRHRRHHRRAQRRTGRAAASTTASSSPRSSRSWLVRRSGMFPVVIAPPIVYSLGSGGMLYIRSGGLPQPQGALRRRRQLARLRLPGDRGRHRGRADHRAASG